MVALTDFIGKPATSARARGKVRVEPTGWGYVLQGRFSQASLLPLVRFLAIVAGFAFIIAALGIWVVPRAAAADVVLMRLGASALFLYFGVVLVQMGEDVGRPEVHLDISRNEVRIVERSNTGTGKLLAVHRFDQLSELRVRDGMLVIATRDGARLAEVELESRESQMEVTARLRHEGYG